MEFRYEALLSLQSEGGKRVVSFSAPATEISLWAGIPQKKRFDDGEETAGFQREDNPKRIQALATFLKDPRNTLQNPLLCSERAAEGCKVEFVPAPGSVGLGHITVSLPDWSAMPLAAILGRVQDYLEVRVPALKGRKPSDATISRLQLRARQDNLLPDAEGEGGETDVVEAEGVHDDEDAPEGHEVEAGLAPGAAAEGGVPTAALFEESHVAEFWDEVAGRRLVLEKIDPEFPGNHFLGFSREALEGYIRPVVVMDGQHRLRGALAAARDYLDSPEAIAETELRIDAGEDAGRVTEDLMRHASRRLSVSLLLDPNPAEHVFQFVVVNQKATPIGRALLGTIVSTSLSNEELSQVAERLQTAGIPLDESRAASLMARRSPFAGLVDLGMVGDNRNELLPWPVMVSLVQIFRDLQGGNLYHQKNSDYARSWARDHLDASPIVASFRDKNAETPLDYWRSFDGPWRGVFTTFWTQIRDVFGDVGETSAGNYWGNPRQSNLFNKPSLHILAADFFRYMLQTEVSLRDEAHVVEVMRKWLAKVDASYFVRDWKLDRAGVKKDSSGIRYAWAKLWDEYRTSPTRLPRIENYSKPSMV